MRRCLALLFLLVSAVRAASKGKTSGASSSSGGNLIYLIRHGEKPSDDSPGLTSQGKARAACISTKWSLDKKFTALFAPAYKPDGSRKRAFDTITPLASRLHETINTKCDRDDTACIVKAAKAAQAKGNVLVAWEHKELTNIAKKLSGQSLEYPGSTFDLVWIVDAKGKLTKSTEGCNHS